MGTTKAMFSFSVFGRIFTARTWFWLFSQFVKFLSLRTHSTLNHMRSRNQDKKLLKIHNKASIKFSSLLIFKLSSCDPSPSLITSRRQIFESWSNQFYSSKFNSIICSNFYDTKGRHEKKTILRCLVRPVVTLQLLVWMSTKIFKSQ